MGNGHVSAFGQDRLINPSSTISELLCFGPRFVNRLLNRTVDPFLSIQCRFLDPMALMLTSVR